MAKKHSSLITSDLHHPKGILVESTDAMLVMSQSINTATASFHFIPGDSDTYTLGNAGRPWKELYVSTSSINFMDKTGNTVQTMTATSEGVTFASGSEVSNISGSIISGSKLHIVGDTFIGGDLTLGDADSDSISIGADLTSNLIPNANATYDLGSATKGWNDLHLGAAGVINWANGGITLTETSDVLVQSGGNLRVPRLEIDSAADYVDVDTDLKIIAAADIILDPGGNNVLPGSDDADDLGASGTQWKDLYIDGVAYIDTLNADALGANLDHGNFNSTNVDIDSGAIDGTTIGAASHNTIKGTTIDATTDFTIDGLVLTADTITNDANLTMDLAGDLAIDVDGGDVVITDDGADILTINATTISGSATSSGSFAHIAVNSVSASRIELDNIQGNWTNAGNTVADLGSITTADINGGTVDGATIGASSHTTIKGTTIDATTDFTIGGTVITDNTITDDGTLVIASTTATSFSDGNITNVGDIALDTISADDGSSLSFSNNWTNAGRTVADLGIVTTVDINGGSIDGTTIGAASAVAGTFAAIVGTTIDATTDFTIGSTVITDDSIVMTPSTSDTITFSGATNGALAITTVDDAAAAANITITADGTFEAIGTTVTLDSGGAINLEPAAGSAILLDGTISVDAGVVTGATSITSTAFVGTSDGVVGGNTPAAGTFTTLVATGDVDLGDATGDTITVTGRFDSDIVPSTDSARDLGTSALQFAEAHIDTGHIDTITATGTSTLTTVDINGGNIDGTVIGAATPASGSFTGIIVTGGMEVRGDLTYVSSSNLDIGDRIVTLNAGSAAGDGGLYVNDADTTETGSLLWDVSEDRWIGGLKDAEVNLVTISSTDTLTNKTLTSPDINGGTWNGTVDGNSTAAGITWADLGSVTTCDINGGTINGITDLAVADGGTGAGTFTDGGILLGSGTSAITATAVLGDGEILIGDGTTDPVALDIGSSTAITILGTIATGVWNGTALTGTYIGNDAIDSQHYASESIDIEHIKAEQIDSHHYVDGSIDRVHLAADIVDGTKIADDVVDSEHLAAGGIDDEHLSDGVATGLAGAGTTATSGVLNVIGGDGITANANDVAVTAAQTTITSVLNTGLKVGYDNDDCINFATGSDGQISVYQNAIEEFRFTAGGTFHADADVVAYSSTVASDMNLKENITDMKYGLSDVMKLRGVEYDWKREDMGHDVGVLAQEVEAVIPELVKEHEGLHGRGKFKSVDYNKLVPVLIESIKELKKEIDDLKSN